MLFSRRTEYAIRALGELAGQKPDGWVMLDNLIQDERMPRDFLAKVFQRLVRSGLLHSSKGRGGGFALARPAREITLMDVLVACEGPQPFDRCVVRFDECNDQTPCPQHDLYRPIRQRLQDYLTTTTLADLADSLRDKRLAIAALDGSQSAPPASSTATVPLTVIATSGGKGANGVPAQRAAVTAAPAPPAQPPPGRVAGDEDRERNRPYVRRRPPS